MFIIDRCYWIGDPRTLDGQPQLPCIDIQTPGRSSNCPRHDRVAMGDSRPLEDYATYARMDYIPGSRPLINHVTGVGVSDTHYSIATRASTYENDPRDKMEGHILHFSYGSRL